MPVIAHLEATQNCACKEAISLQIECCHSKHLPLWLLILVLYWDHSFLWLQCPNMYSLFITSKILHIAICRVINKWKYILSISCFLSSRVHFFKKYVNKRFMVCLVLLNERLFLKYLKKETTFNSSWQVIFLKGLEWWK